MDVTELERLLVDAGSRRDWVDSVARYFASHELCFGHGTDNAADEAFWLVWHLSGMPDSLAGLKPDPEQVGVVVELAERRVVERMPLAYLLGTAWFAGLDFAVGPEVLVPRSPLAELVERRFEPWCRLAPGDRVLEIGAGSGCIAIATAVLHPDLRVDATEIDAPALAVARANARRHDVGDRVRFIESDLFPRGDDRYRVIISNPPYVPTGDIASLPIEYQREPRSALDGGEDGLDIVRRILAGAGRHLVGDGVLIVEVGQSADALMAAYPHRPWTWLEFERGGEGVFLLTADELNDGWR